MGSWVQALVQQSSPALPPNAWLRWDLVRRVLPAGGDVLEIGCGQGGFGVRLARRYRYVGIDLNSESIAIAKARMARHGASGELRHGDLSVVGPDEVFDVVCAFEVLEHIEDDVAAVASWSRHLRPGGILVLSVPGWQRRYGAWDEMAGHYRRYDPAAMREVLERAGLAEARAIPFGWPISYLLEAVRHLLARRRGLDSAGSTFESRTAASGRFLRLPDGVRAIVPHLATWPFLLIQQAVPGRGTNLLATARRR